MAEGTRGTPGGEVAGRASALGLRIPADAGRPVTLAVLRLTASELSDAIGGGLLDDTLTAETDGCGYTFYLDEQRVAKCLPGNDRAAVLAARLGHVNRKWLADLRGDALVLGCDGRLDDVGVPRLVVDAAVRSGLFAQSAWAGNDPLGPKACAWVGTA